MEPSYSVHSQYVMLHNNAVTDCRLPIWPNIDYNASIANTAAASERQRYMTKAAAIHY